MIIIFKKFGVKMKYHFALLAAAVAAAAFAVFEPAIHTHHAVYDDAYVLGQRDLHMPFSEWLASGCSLRCFHTLLARTQLIMLKSAPPRIYNDCWGTPMNSALSNQQWRPAVALGLRLSLRLAGCGPADIQAIHAHCSICQPSLLRQLWAGTVPASCRAERCCWERTTATRRRPAALSLYIVGRWCCMLSALCSFLPLRQARCACRLSRRAAQARSLAASQRQASRRHTVRSSHPILLASPAAGGSCSMAIRSPSGARGERDHNLRAC